jgi:hypothetical protein
MDHSLKCVGLSVIIHNGIVPSKVKGWGPSWCGIWGNLEIRVKETFLENNLPTIDRRPILVFLVELALLSNHNPYESEPGSTTVLLEVR